MSRKAPNITDTELSVLKVLWEQESATARTITQVLYPACTESDVGTVHSMLQRLEKKQLVHRDRGRRPHVFSALVSQEDVAGQQLVAMAERITDGSFVPFLTHLVEAERLSDEEVEGIRRLIRRHASKPRKRDKR